jgi:uncharacterized caspase-like protein
VRKLLISDFKFFESSIMRNLISAGMAGRRGRPDLSFGHTLAKAVRAAAFALTLIAFSVIDPTQASAEQKIALVIGNSEYRKVDRLTNPANDAADMAASLTRLGFAVKHLSNLDFAAFRRALIDFGNAARTADKAVIFFAGHGVEIDGKNWLIPVDAQIKSEVDVYAEAINLETLIDISVMPKIIGLVVLDACRNDPFASTNLAAGRALSNPTNPAGKGSKDATKKGAQTATPARPVPATPAETAVRGLAPVEVNDNVLVAFAAAAGTTANDGTGRNSPYSGSLLRHVETPGLEINYVFRNVYDDVVRETKNQQPAVYGTLSREEIYLKGDATVAAADAEAEAERVAWTFVRATNEIATLRRFAEKFPTSTHVAEVNDRIAQLEGAEKFAWSTVEKQNTAAAYRAFLDLYPYSEHVDGARVTLAKLQASGQKDSQSVDLIPPPPATFQLASAAPEATAKNHDSIDRAWDVLRNSRDKDVVRPFAEKYPSIRDHRLPAGSEVALRPINPTDWMMRTGQDNDVNLCFTGDVKACAKAVVRYPDYMQLRFQLCRTSGNKNRCMEKAVDDARKNGYLVSAYTRSEKEKVRNREYRKVVERVNQNVSNTVSNVVSNVVSSAVSNAVSNAVNNAVSQAASNAAAAAASRAASAAAAAAAANAASSAASNAAGRAASNAASQAASNAASRAASSAASNAASRAASSAASNAASKAASNAAANAASRIPVPSDMRLKQDITALGQTHGGLPLYRYRYIGDDTFYVGVMAQEVTARVPAAVSQADDGYLQVDYDMLGLKFLTWRDWAIEHPTGVTN